MAILTGVSLLLTIILIVAPKAIEQPRQAAYTGSLIPLVLPATASPCPTTIENLAEERPRLLPTPSQTAEPTTTPRPTRKPTPKPTRKPVVASVPRYTAPATTAAQRYARRQVGATQYACLYRLWMRESRWNYRAVNRRSGACGIPQAYPCSKMRTAGADYLTNPITQVKWGLRYISGRYGTPCRALQHALTYGWY